LVLPLFLRDPISGYAILVLAAIVIAFIAYPLFEAVRLTLVKMAGFPLMCGRRFFLIVSI